MDSEKDGLLKPPVNASAVNSSTYHPSVLVVISHYNAWSSDQLIALLDQMWSVPAGYAFQARIVVKRAEPHDLALPPRYQSVEVLYRQNVGFDTELTMQARQEIPGLHDRVLTRIAQGRWARPEDMAGTAVWLASSASDYVTGVAIPVDGGYSAAL